MENTISGIVGITKPTILKNLEEEVIDLYNSTLSEEHYDTDDISTIICEALVTKYLSRINDSVPEHDQDIMACRMIYDIFDICKTHVRRLNLQHTHKQIAEDIQSNMKQTYDARMNHIFGNHE